MSRSIKNDHAVLPLKPGAKIGIAGPFANAKNTSGGWSLVADKNFLILAGSLSEKGYHVITAMGAELGSMEQKIFDVEDHVSEAVAAFADCDVVRYR